jgi:hypothetical protein
MENVSEVVIDESVIVGDAQSNPDLR